LWLWQPRTAGALLGLLAVLVGLSLWVAGVGWVELAVASGVVVLLGVFVGVGAFLTGRWRSCPGCQGFSEVIEDSQGERLCGRCWLVELGRGPSL
jgi:hypothetical protein